MPSLGDYLGQMLSEITHARVQSDLEAARIAEMYAGHPLLRHMPVPRFRMPNVTVDVPVAISSLGGESGDTRAVAGGIAPAGDAAARDTETKATLSTTSAPAPSSGFHDALARTLARHSVKLTRAQRQALYRVVDREVGAASGRGEFDIGPRAVAQRVAGATVQALEGPQLAEAKVEQETLDLIRRELAAEVRSELLSRGPLLPRLDVAVTNAALKEAGSPDMLLRLTLTISEDAVQWSEPDPDDPDSARLVPE